MSETIKKSEETSLKIADYKDKIAANSEKNEEFLSTVEPIRNHLSVLVDKVRKLEATKDYLESLQTIKKIRFVYKNFHIQYRIKQFLSCNFIFSYDLSQCTDSEQSVLLIQQLHELQKIYKEGHRGEFVTETTHYWYNVLKDKLSM